MLNESAVPIRRHELTERLRLVALGGVLESTESESDGLRARQDPCELSWKRELDRPIFKLIDQQLTVADVARVVCPSEDAIRVSQNGSVRRAQIRSRPLQYIARRHIARAAFKVVRSTDQGPCHPVTVAAVHR